MRTDLFSAGEHVFLACWLVVLLTVVLFIRFGSAKAPCAIEPRPAAAIWPLRYLRTMIEVEPRPDWRTANLDLYDADRLLLRSSLVWDQTGGVLAPRHTLLEWSSLPPSEPGDYLVVLRVSTAQVDSGCDARATVRVVD